jgi:hypothetical protein
MSSLAGYRTRIHLILGDTSATRYSNNLVDEGLRQALDQYSKAWPQVLGTSVTVATAGRDQSLSALTGLQSILQVIYPYTATNLTPYYFTAYYFTFGPTPNIHISGDAVPAVGEKIYITYTKAHGIKDLDSATSTSVLDTHEGTICQGAAGFSAIMRASEISEAYGSRASDQDQLVQIGKAFLEVFYKAVDQLKANAQVHRTVTPPAGWSLDNWDITSYDRN